MEHVSPIAARVIEKAGGVGAVAEITGRSTVSVHRWTYPKEKGGTGGYVPRPAQKRLLEHFQNTDIPLTPDDFFDLSPEQEGVS